MGEALKVVYYAPKDIRVEPFGDAIPAPKAGEVVIKVEAAAICGSDLKTYLHGNPRMKPPATIGHEFCGGIIALGEGVRNHRIGQRVTMATTIGCGECVYCKEGRTNICKSSEAMGFTCNGAMASYAVIPANAVAAGHLLDVGDLSADVAAVCEPMSCAINGISRLPLDKIQNAVIIGTGALGMFHAIALREAGVSNIVTMDNDPGIKQKMLEDLGFKFVHSDAFDAQYLELSGGEGFDLVVITAPSNKVQGEAPKYARKGGYVSYFASLPVGSEMLQINARTIHYNELFLFGTSDSTPEHVKKAVELITRQQDSVRKLITKMPLADFQKGLDAIINRTAAKVVLIP